jgi:hypothetical protein
MSPIWQVINLILLDGFLSEFNAANFFRSFLLSVQWRTEGYLGITTYRILGLQNLSALLRRQRKLFACIYAVLYQYLFVA